MTLPLAFSLGISLALVTPDTTSCALACVVLSTAPNPFLIALFKGKPKAIVFTITGFVFLLNGLVTNLLSLYCKLYLKVMIILYKKYIFFK